MRSLEQARQSWQELSQYKSLRDLKDAVRLDAGSSVATRGLRSACWKAFLLCESVDVTEWQRTLTSSRSAYNSLRSHFFRYIENPDDVGAGHDPLSQESESSPWSQAQQDEELRAEILQDVDRCMPENAFFRQSDTQKVLLDVLFVFCKLNPDVGYRQGMHEIAAPILWVVHDDAIDVGEGSKALGEDAVIKAVFDAEHIEHDTFAIFGQVMQNAKTFYISDGPVSIASRSRHIFNELLPLVDKEVMKHLESLDIVPQVFCIRWMRLLFGREFEFDSVLTLWDVIFAEDQSLEICEFICVAMLLRIRWHLLDADYNAALGILLRYPEQDKDFPAQTFGLDALYLQTHMTSEGGRYLVLKYTGRPLTSGRPSTPPALQRNITTFAVQRRQKMSPPRTPRSSRNIEAILQNTAKNIYARSEKLGIGRAVRTAVDEVHKKAQEIRESQTSPARPGSGLLINRMRDLEMRNQKLAELLAGAVDELWEYEKLVATPKTADDQSQPQVESIDKLSAAIAKVQFVQVYLDEPTLELPEAEQEKTDFADGHGDEPEPSAPLTTSGVSEQQEDLERSAHTSDAMRPFQGGLLADPSTFEDFEDHGPPTSAMKPSDQAVDQSASSHIAAPTVGETPVVQATPSSPPPRPSLEQSSFSFMLGQDSTDSGAFGKAETPPRARSRLGASLFGSQGTRSGSRDNTPQKEADRPDDDFDLSTLRRARMPKK